VLGYATGMLYASNPGNLALQLADVAETAVDAESDIVR